MKLVIESMRNRGRGIVTKPRAGCPINLSLIHGRDNIYIFYKMFMPAQDPTKSFVFSGYRGLFPRIKAAVA
jgi:hypothetical protein